MGYIYKKNRQVCLLSVANLQKKNQDKDADTIKSWCNHPNFLKLISIIMT